MGLADLHIHTIHSYDGTSSVSAVLEHVADHTNLDVIAITDHDSMAGVHEALELAPAYGIEVITVVKFQPPMDTCWRCSLNGQSRLDYH